MDLDGRDRSRSPLVLLTGTSAPTEGTAALAAALAPLGPVLQPRLEVGSRRPAGLDAPALAVLAALTAADADEAVLCGLSFGAMVALQVAASHPRRVLGLVLCTAARPVATTVRSVHRGVSALLPARTLPTWGDGRRTVLDALDQVRRVDYAPLAPRVQAPALVLYGDEDPVNARASRLLAKALPHASAVAVAGAGPDWMWSEPERWAEAAQPFVQQRRTAS